MGVRYSCYSRVSREGTAVPCPLPRREKIHYLTHVAKIR